MTVKVKKKYSGCTVDGCVNLYRAKGYCSTHWTQMQKFGKIVPVRPKRKVGTKPDRCSVDNCEGDAKSRNMCIKHYRRWLMHGSPFINYKNKYKKEMALDHDKLSRFYNLTDDEKQFLTEMTDVNVHVYDF